MSVFKHMEAEAEYLLTVLKEKAQQELAAYGVTHPTLAAFIEKLSGHVDASKPEPTPEPEPEPAAVAAFMDGVPHEQFTHEDDVVESKSRKG